MNRLAISLAAVLLAFYGAQAAANDAHAIDSRGTVWRNAYGECWRTSQWTPAAALPGCDGALAPSPAPRPAAAPAPVPVPVPAAAPAPAPVRVVLDSDGDGVVDRLDRCPGTKPGAKVDANGCEIPEVIALKGVNFATNSATLTPGSSAILDEATAALVKRGDVRVEVAGHTDSRGVPARNVTLSQQRAESVMRYLVSKGVNSANLTARGYGQNSPVADNKTESGRAANRRVELRIVK